VVLSGWQFGLVSSSTFPHSTNHWATAVCSCAVVVGALMQMAAQDQEGAFVLRMGVIRLEAFWLLKNKVRVQNGVLNLC
jgi:hypothetical protein